MEAGKGSKHVKVIEKMFNILECFNSEQNHWTLTDLAEQAGLDKSTTFRILNTLKSRGYIIQDNQSRKFRMSMKMFELGSVPWNTLNVVSLSRPALRKLASYIQETVFLTALEGNYGICVDQIESSYQLRTKFHLGKRMHLHAGASNKVLLAYMPKPERQAIINATGLPKFCINTLIDAEKLEENLALIRKLGYAYSEEETDKGLYGVAAPVFDSNGAIIASIGLAAPLARLDKKELTSIGELVKNESEAVTEKLSGHNIS
jgi:IclR family transcriptional regulator, KDG regulon repressor